MQLICINTNYKPLAAFYAYPLEHDSITRWDNFDLQNSQKTNVHRGSMHIPEHHKCQNTLQQQERQYNQAQH